MKQVITTVIFQVVVGLFLVIMWGVDIDKIGFLRFAVGWVVGIGLLMTVWPQIKKKYWGE
jgi:uncharacterized membrane protein YccC